MSEVRKLKDRTYEKYMILACIFLGLAIVISVVTIKIIKEELGQVVEIEEVK